ncbi:hypothetical protein GF420_16090 [candidate division GN15 bacterium]|nr:hypothetical protein [candidate division GN15 bacterium]
MERPDTDGNRRSVAALYDCRPAGVRLAVRHCPPVLSSSGIARQDG